MRRCVRSVYQTLQRMGWSFEQKHLITEVSWVRGARCLPALPLTATCVRVPVEVGHSASMLVETERALEIEEARAALAAQPLRRWSQCHVVQRL